MTVKYTSSRPDEALDALQGLEDEWSRPEQEPDQIVVVAKVSRHAIQKKEGGDWQVTAGFRHVEVVDGVDRDTALGLLARAQQERTGETPLELPDAEPAELPDEPWHGEHP